MVYTLCCRCWVLMCVVGSQGLRFSCKWSGCERTARKTREAMLVEKATQWLCYQVMFFEWTWEGFSCSFTVGDKKVQETK